MAEDSSEQSAVDSRSSLLEFWFRVVLASCLAGFALWSLLQDNNDTKEHLLAAVFLILAFLHVWSAVDIYRTRRARRD